MAAGAGLALGRTRGVAPAIATGAATYLAVAGRELGAVAQGVGALAASDLARARELLPALVGRDVTSLDTLGVARAVVESVAENSVDAPVAPAWWATGRSGRLWLPGRQHPRFHGGSSQRPLRPIRLGQRTTR